MRNKQPPYPNPKNPRPGKVQYEVWKDVYGFSRYQVSNLGRVLSKDYKLTGKKKVLRPYRRDDGYHFVTLRKNNKSYNCRVHLIVAETFLGPKPDGLDVNHLDGNKANNEIYNLEYCTRSENIKHAFRNGLSKISDKQKTLISKRSRGEKNARSKLTKKDVIEIKKNKGLMTQKELGDKYGVHGETIGKIHRRETWRHIKQQKIKTGQTTN